MFTNLWVSTTTVVPDKLKYACIQIHTNEIAEVLKFPVMYIRAGTKLQRVED